MRIIRQCNAREILDSRGIPTLEVDVILNDGSFGQAAVPAPAEDKSDLREAAAKVVGNVNEKMVAATGADWGCRLCEREVDKFMIALDGAKGNSKLGANAMFGVPLAVYQAAAQHSLLPLHRYFGDARITSVTSPTKNTLNGGMQTNDSVDLQEFIIMPVEIQAETLLSVGKRRKECPERWPVGSRQWAGEPQIPRLTHSLWERWRACSRHRHPVSDHEETSTRIGSASRSEMGYAEMREARHHG